MLWCYTRVYEKSTPLLYALPMHELPYVPASELVVGMELKALPEGYVPLGAVMVIKTLDPEGDVAWHTRYPKDIHNIECFGALHAAIKLMGRDIIESYTPDEEDD